MTKIAMRRPVGWKGPVRITDDKYEIWHVIPTCLGIIRKQGLNWYTEDGHRHVSSMDATNYLVRLQQTADAGKVDLSGDDFTPPPRPRARSAQQQQKKQSVEVEPEVEIDMDSYREFLKFKKFQKEGERGKRPSKTAPIPLPPSSTPKRKSKQKRR